MKLTDRDWEWLEWEAGERSTLTFMFSDDSPKAVLAVLRGFTKEMVGAIRHATSYSPCDDEETWRLVAMVSDRIEALLPDD